MFVMASMNDLWNHIAYVLVYAPDSFPYRDFLAPDEQMTLDRAFQMLRAGVEIAYPEAQFADKRTELCDILDSSLSAYRKGHDVQGGTLLNAFESRIFKQ